MNWLTTAKRRSLKKRNPPSRKSLSYHDPRSIYKSMHVIKYPSEDTARSHEIYQKNKQISSISKDVLYLKKRPVERWEMPVVSADEPSIIYFDDGQRCDQNGNPVFRLEDTEFTLSNEDNDESDLVGQDDWVEILNQQIKQLKNPNIGPIAYSNHFAADLRQLLEKLYHLYDQYGTKISSSNISVTRSPVNLLQLIRDLEIHLKHRASPTILAPESPLDSLILTQYERDEEHTPENQEAYSNLECNNEDLVNGGYGLETKREDVYYDIDKWNLFGS